jgi:CDP-diacylglycerol--glycerol-3-phosphate 3-phosphatidyltransferase
MNVPNAITIARVFLALLAVSLLWSGSDTVLWTSFVLTAIIIWGDGLDGYFARKLNQATKLGAILDIAGDRVVEMAYWIVFAILGWIPAWIPLLFLVRGTFVDAIRAQASEQGKTAFGEKTMMESPLGKLLVSSNFSRGSYAVVKAVAFCLLIAARTKVCQATLVPTIAIYCAYASAAFCVIRGLPVLVEGRSLFEAKTN